MKIAYDPQIFCSQNYGGISRYFCEIASRIAKEPGIQVSIVAPMHINAYLERMPRGIVSGFRAPDTERFQSVHGRNYPRLALQGLGLLMGDAMLRTIRPDIVHETYFFPYRLGTRRARRVLTIHDMIQEKFAWSSPYADKTARYKALAAERADHIICVSESTRRDAIDILNLPPDKTSVIYHGIGLMNTAATDVRELVLHKPDPDPFILYVGNRGGYKNFLRLLEAYGTSPQLRSGYELICFGGGVFQPDELKMIHKLGLDTGQVRQLGGDDRLLAELYKNAAAFIFPSLYEGFGLPPLEAMSCECPVVCSSLGSIPEVVGDAGKYFDPYDVASIQSSIEMVAESGELRESLLAKGKQRLNFFSWDKCAKKTMSIYENLV